MGHYISVRNPVKTIIEGVVSTTVQNTTENPVQTEIQGTVPTTIEHIVPVTVETPVEVEGTVSIGNTINTVTTIQGTPTVAVQGTVPVSIAGTLSTNATIQGTPNVNATMVLNTSTTLKKTTTNVNNASCSIALANSNRKAFYIYNDSAAALYICFEATATTSGPVKVMSPGESWSVNTGCIWRGQISAIRVGLGIGNVIVSEIE